MVEVPLESIGEYWLRGKMFMHERDTFKRVDPQSTHAAVKDVLASLDLARLLLKQCREASDG